MAAIFNDFNYEQSFHEKLKQKIHIFGFDFTKFLYKQVLNHPLHTIVENNAGRPAGAKQGVRGLIGRLPPPTQLFNLNTPTGEMTMSQTAFPELDNL